MMRLLQQPLPTPTLFPVDLDPAPILVDRADWGMWQHMPWGVQVWNRLPGDSATIIQIVIIVAIVIIFVRLIMLQFNKIMEEGDK